VRLRNFQSYPQIIYTSSEAHRGTAQLFKLQNNTNAHPEDKIDLNGSKKLFTPTIPPMFKIQ
jgi:hypothetical protein